VSTTATETWNRRASKPPGRDHISFSSVSTYQSCPLRYFFRYVLGLPEDTVSASLVFGSAIHSALQHHYEQLLIGEEAPDLDELLDVFQRKWEEYDQDAILFPKSDNRDSLGRLADSMLRAFRVNHFANPHGTIIGVEEELRGQLIPGCPDLLARVDLMIETDDALVVTDFKTSRRTWSSDQVNDAAPQLLLYHELASKLSDGKPLRLNFAVLTKTKTPDFVVHPVNVDARQIERTKRIVERVWKAIQAEHFFPSPSPMNCPTCPFQKQCRAWTG